MLARSYILYIQYKSINTINNRLIRRLAGAVGGSKSAAIRLDRDEIGLMRRSRRGQTGPSYTPKQLARLLAQ
jgi:hypothetical protein